MSGAGGVIWISFVGEVSDAKRNSDDTAYVPASDLAAAEGRLRIRKEQISGLTDIATAAEARIVELEAEVARVNTLRHETCLELARKSVAAEAVADRRLGLLRLASYEIRLPSDLRELIQNELTASRGGSGGSAWVCAMCGQKNSSWSTECGRCEAKPPPSG